MSKREQFEKLQAEYRAAEKIYRDFEISQELYYGPGNWRSWTSKANRTKDESMRKKLDRIGGRIYKLLEGSPRDWSSGIPTHYVYTQLTWDDATRPVSQALSKTPPAAYGHSERDMMHFASARTR